jgi:hypothetical protein
MKTMKAVIIAALGLIALGGCAEDNGRDIGTLGIALTAPAADVGEIRSLGLYAVALVSPEFECSDYLSREVDPISRDPEALVAVDYVDVPQGSSEVPFSFRGVPIGERSIVVEAYDGGGGRLFMGCEQTLIEEGRTAIISILMVEDPIVP